MRIAILVGGLPPLYNGGTEIATTKIAEYAAKAGHDVHVLAGDTTGKGYEGLYEFPVHTIESVPAHYFFGIRYGQLAIKVLAQLKPDLIHAQALYMAPAAWRAKRKWGTPYILYERGGIYRPSLLNDLYRVFLRDATRVVAQTEDQKNALRKYVDRNDIEVIPNGIDADRFLGADAKMWARKLLGLPLDKQIVLSVGRCRLEKNLGQFVKAAQMDEGRQWVLVGDGPELEKLKGMAAGRVIFTGAVDNRDVPKYMAAADILVNTSLTEGFPLAVLEGMASGLPIIAPNVTGIPEIVWDGVNGLLVPVNDADATVAAVKYLLANNHLMNSISERNRRKAREYTWENVVRRLYG